MKRFLSSLVAVFTLAVVLTSCNSNSPKAVADKFLTGLYHYDYESASKVSTDETKKMLDMMKQFSSMIPDSAKKAAKKIKINIKDVKEQGDNATATYTTSIVPTDQTLKMVKQNGKWLVQWSKQDQMGGSNGGDATQGAGPADQPEMTDSTANIPSHTIHTPSSADTAMAK